MSAIVSFLCPSYNHEKYVKFFIESLLKQTNPNWELIIVDDCSTDNNVNEIKKFKDKRIKLFKNPFNMGMNSAINHVFKYTKGQYICFCGTDDMLKSDYVDNVIKSFQDNPDKDVLYFDLQLIDENNDLIKNDVWKNEYSSRFEALKHLFMTRNCLLSPGVAIRKETLNKIMPLTIPLSQYQDYKIHVDLLINSDFMISDKKLVLYRKPSKKSGVSFLNKNTSVLYNLEENLLMDSFLQIKDVKILKNIFGEDLLKQFGVLDNKFIPYYLGLLALQNAETEYKKLWGYNQIVKFIIIPENYENLYKKYGFSFKQYLGLSKYFDNTVSEIKARKYKTLFNIMCCVCFVFLVITIGFLM